MGMGEPVALKLQELGLEQYASAIVDDQGYNMVETLQSLSAEELGELADDVKMKPGHNRTFLSGFGTSASTAAPPEVKVDMGGAKGPVALKLQELGLEQYASAIVDDQGYDSVETLQSLER